MKILVGYVPVMHQGYINFFQKHRDAEALYIFGLEIIQYFDHLVRKEIRAIDPEVMCSVIRSLDIFPKVEILDVASIASITNDYPQIVFADESEAREVADRLFKGCDIIFDSVFLRWDRDNLTKVMPIESFMVSADEMHQLFMNEAEQVSKQSSDWWRRVGAVLVSGNEKVVAYNRHIPSEQTPYVLGDPRNLLKKGIGVEITSALHAEAGIVASALRNGISTKGARLYVTTFPCPYCANMLAQTGISELYFNSGYSVLDGAKILENAGIKIFRVLKEKPSE